MSDILTVSGAGKSYGAVDALVDAELRVREGEVHAICGDNGAGKSTLVKLISGVEQPDRGTITVKGRPVRFAGPHDALAGGIATIHQDLGLAPKMSIYQNVFMGSELERRVLVLRMLDRPAMIRAARRYLPLIESDNNDKTAALQ